MCLLFALFYVAPFTTWWYNNNLFCSFILYISVRISTTNYWVDLYNRDFQTTIAFFTRNASSYKTDWIFTTGCLLCFAYVNSLANFPEVDCSSFRFLGNFIVTSLLFAYFVHITYCCVCLLAYSFFSHTDVVGLHKLGFTSSLYLFV